MCMVLPLGNRFVILHKINSFRKVKFVTGATMPSERDKTLAGELYDPLDRELVAARIRGAKNRARHST